MTAKHFKVLLFSFMEFGCSVWRIHHPYDADIYFLGIPGSGDLPSGITVPSEKLTGGRKEVPENPNSIHGALLRMNRSIQAERTLATAKWSQSYAPARGRRQDWGACLGF